jgi:hypothetical protein
MTADPAGEENESEIAWAKRWASLMLESDMVRYHLASEKSQASIQKYADSLRMRLPEVPDGDLGRTLIWVADFLARAQETYGADVSPRALMTTFGMVAFELLSIDIAL